MKRQKVDRETSLNSVKYWEIFDIRLFGGGEGEVLNMIQNWLRVNSGTKWIATVNPEFVVAAQKDPYFKEILSKTSLNVVDGIGLIWAKEIMTKNKGIKASLGKIAKGFKVGMEILKGKYRENLVGGADLMDSMCKMAEKMGKTVYFYGGWDDRSKRTAEYFLRKYPKLKVAGYRAEDYDWETKADILFVARAMKKQEEWIENNFLKLKVGVVMGVGRSFDYYSGELKRAPRWLRKMGLEWLYSLYKEPKRWKRQLALPKFIWKVLTD